MEAPARAVAETPLDATASLNAIEPMYPLAVAVELIPFPTLHALNLFLHNHKEEFPPRYRERIGPKNNRRGVSQRFLSETEILLIREMQFHSDWRRGRGKRHSLLDTIIARARA